GGRHGEQRIALDFQNIADAHRCPLLQPVHNRLSILTESPAKGKRAAAGCGGRRPAAQWMT
ncbi:hypothetical protein KEX41_25105, partial [Burkholderia thailandensis]|uniref:hypothetical protein n=1 Tax=Burkholderia thailandensis TaxID=57975 RepID=UPI001BA810DA